jgi:hypothetical protein
MFIHFRDHEPTRAEQLNFQGFNARVLDVPRDFGPDFFVISPVFRDQLRIVPQVQCHTEAPVHLAVLTPIFLAWFLFIP